MREHPRPWPNPWKGIDNGNGSGLRSVWWVRIDAAQQGRRSRSPANVQLTHFSCNIAKNNRALPQGEQLRLIG